MNPPNQKPLYNGVTAQRLFIGTPVVMTMLPAIRRGILKSRQIGRIKFELLRRSASGHSRPRWSTPPALVRPQCPESGSKISVLASAAMGLLRVDGVALHVIRAPKLESRIMRYELSDFEWATIKPMLPNKPRGMPRVNDRRVLNGIFWVTQRQHRLRALSRRGVSDRLPPWRRSCSRCLVPAGRCWRGA
jgi:hypothetical protein